MMASFASVLHTLQMKAQETVAAVTAGGTPVSHAAQSLHLSPSGEHLQGAHRVPTGSDHAVAHHTRHNP